MTQPVRLITILSTLLILFLGSSLHGQESCTLRQITFFDLGHGTTDAVDISADGSILSLAADPAQILHEDVFVADLTANSLLQLTPTPSNPPIPSLSRDGTAVVFNSSVDLIGDNPDLNDELFLYDVGTDTFLQITDTLDGPDSMAGSVSPDGSFAVFSDRHVHDGPPNPDNNEELYLWNRAGNTFQRLTDGSRSSATPSVSPDGSLVSFQSKSDFFGMNPDHNREIFVMDLGTLVIQQVTDTSDCVNHSLSGSAGESIDASGSLLLFSSNCDFGGQNPGFGTRPIVANLKSNDIEVIGASATGTVVPNAISHDGITISLYSDGDFTGNNGDGSLEVFLYNRESAEFLQVTSGTDPNRSRGGTLSEDGSVIAFNSDEDFLGTNPDNVFQAWVCEFAQASSVEVPTLSLWSLLILGAMIGGMGLLVLGRP